ncbi:hypothetical protein A2215_03245 [Candidatus Berkelbacteria bacterium RIFOXYA2_FULL_43_10]|uniref:Uncharacterized protein n=1 Tax=Candidatus Berkelbacteria bacterium RIFOXYA2_FULL_43_10 TaxID=1797472 RepID=A0A1F5EEH3_9BACT|nr:MAG: hypothetical protein A2215_03245 [Candidatus Berkelbacteria bacterium RIFOXYA2_FULL_43_10]
MGEELISPEGTKAEVDYTVKTALDALEQEIKVQGLTQQEVEDAHMRFRARFDEETVPKLSAEVRNEASLLGARLDVEGLIMIASQPESPVPRPYIDERIEDALDKMWDLIDEEANRDPESALVVKYENTQRELIRKVREMRALGTD